MHKYTINTAPVTICRKEVAMRITKAFTLIELLVVIAIIAILMAILMPALRSAKDHGKRIVCSSHLKTLGLANVLYSDEANGWYVPIMDRTLGDDRYWPSNLLFRELIGYKPKNAVSNETWNAPGSIYVRAM